MNIDDAIYHTVHDHPGGLEALAVRLGKHPGTLRHEVRPPPGSTAKMGLKTAQSIMALSNDHRVLHAMAADLGQMCIPMPDLSDMGDGSAERLARLAKEFADVMVEVAAAVGDGKVSDNELSALRRQWGELLAAGDSMLRHFARLNEAGKPPAAALSRPAAVEAA